MTVSAFANAFSYEQGAFARPDQIRIDLWVAENDFHAAPTLITGRCSQRVGNVPMLDNDISRDIDNAGHILAVLGFQHFAMAENGDDVELVPLRAVAGKTTVISPCREDLTRAGVV